MTPTFVIIPGAWHVKGFASSTIDLLEASNYPAQAVTLPSVGTTKSLSDDASFLRNEVILPLLNAGKDLVLVIHSYGAFPASAAIRGLGKSSRKNGASGILGIILVAAFIPAEDQSLVDMIGGALPPTLDVDEEEGFMRVIDPRPFFYHDVPDPLAGEATKDLELHSLSSFREKAGPVGFADEAYNERRAYIRTIQDVCFPLALQESMIAGSNIEWDIKTMDTSHSPFLSATRELTGYLVAYAKAWS